MSDYTRPPGWRFASRGMNTRSVPDSLPPDKYAALQNVRSVSDQSFQTRPGYTSLFTASAGAPITDIRAYATLGTDDAPRFLARDTSNHLILDSGVTQATLAGPAGQGVSMIPFRPGASPQTWMYCAGLGDYQKLSAPVAGVVTAQKVGIAEPQIALDAAPVAPVFTDFSAVAAGWIEGGTAAAVSNITRSTDTVVAAFADPVIATRFSLQVGTAKPYQIGESLTVNSISVIVQDVLPAVEALTVQAIRYTTGTSGACVIVPSQLPVGQESSQSSLSYLRRGALVRLNASETCLVLSSTVGPNGAMSFTTVTTGTIAAGQAIAGLPSIVVDGSSTGTILASAMSGNQAIGIGYWTQTWGAASSFATNPFSTQLASSGSLAQENDYVHFSLNISDPTQVTEAKIIFNVDTTDATFTQNVYYYSIIPSTLAGIAPNTATQLGAIQSQNTVEQIQVPGLTPAQIAQNLANTFHVSVSDINPAGAQAISFQTNFAQAASSQTTAGTSQWTEVTFPISALTRLGNDQTRTLANCTGVRILVNATGSTGAIVVKFGSLWVGGAGQPDVGADGVPYKYRIVPRSSLTGAKGNASPEMRYGVEPRRQNVTVPLPSVAAALPAADSQVDTWDIYRYGGSVTSYRYIGSGAPSTTFTDQYFDATATGADVLEVDNFEPWVSVDLPFTPSGTITVVGTTITVTGPTSWPANILKWLPGTLIQVGGGNVYTLRARPTALSGTSYLFRIEENAGATAAAASFTIIEPAVARAPVPYMWGPDAYGVMWATGDVLRPGVVYFSKAYLPDSAPDKYTVELCPPSETILGGELINGVSFAASTKRWWAMYPSFGNPAQPYSQIEQPVGRGLITPYGHCTDGTAIFFWAKDCIAAHFGGPFKSLTDVDLYNLFPHEGVTGANITRNGVTFYAPDYSRCATFRLSRAGVYLYADYQDSTGTPRTLVCDLRDGAWSSDAYHDPIRVHYAIEQQSGTVLTNTQPVYTQLVMGDSNGKAWVETDLHNDNLTPIPGVVGTFEFDGGDMRANGWFGDLYLDCRPFAAITAQPVALSTAIGSPTVIAASTSRQFAPVSLAGGSLQSFMGLWLTWTDDYTTQSTATRLHVWQPSLIDKPEIIKDRFGDWDYAGTPGNKFFQGFTLTADTFGVAKGMAVRDAETLTLHTIQPSSVIHNGESTIAYSFTTPFYAHGVRDEPLDLVPWRRFAIQWIFQLAPENAQTWQTQFTAHGMSGYQHIGRIEAAWSCTFPVTLTITSFDGTSPVAITLPPTAGVYQKKLLTPTFNKGTLYRYAAVSGAPFQLWLNDFVIHIGAWARQGPYMQYRLVGGQYGDNANI